MLASLIFSGRDWLLPVLVLAGLGGAALVWGYARAAADKGLRVTCALLKVLGFVALARRGGVLQHRSCHHDHWIFPVRRNRPP